MVCSCQIWLGKLAELPRGSPKPPELAQAQPIFKHDTILCCWAELSSRRTLLFHRQEQDNSYIFLSLTTAASVQNSTVTFAVLTRHEAYLRYVVHMSLLHSFYYTQFLSVSIKLLDISFLIYDIGLPKRIISAKYPLSKNMSD